MIKQFKEAVTRILHVKLAMAPKYNENYADLQSKERALALHAAQESLVLLKNENTLPVKAKQISNALPYFQHSRGLLINVETIDP